MSSEKKIYFTAGPAKIPEEVMQQVHSELLDYKGMGIGVMEMSHRSKQFEAINNEAEANLRKLMNIPDNYAVLFMHAGAKTQFAVIPMNICADSDCKTDYIVNGTWSKMAADDADNFSKVERQLVQNEGKFDRCPTGDQLKDVNSTYRYYCDNETIEGVEYNYVPETGASNCVLVSDMTSNFLSRPVDVSKYGIIFAGAQKNCGISGLAIVIVRKDLIGRAVKQLPKTLNYKIAQEHKSLYNTPSTMAIYIANLCFKWILEKGGLAEMDKICKAKSQLLYDLIDNSSGFYTSPVQKNSRSRMNVVFLLTNKDLDEIFLEEARSSNLFELKGHRSVGGFRASIYHGISLEDVRRLVSFMASFKSKYS